MSSGTQKAGPPRSAQSHSTTTPSSKQLLDKVNARTTTPDSEALASSDDEGDSRQEISQPPPASHKPARRSSWLNDTSHPFSSPRKTSLPGNSLSPTTSNPTTPSADAGSNPWSSHPATSVMGRTTGPSPFPWGTGIWNSERKDPPSRLSEVLPSPTSTLPSGAASNSFFPSDGGAGFSPVASRDQGTNSQIPFAIPLHPTPKTYRSQSYSVGQLEPDNNQTANMSSSAALGRARHSGLQHRPSRPSMLSEMSNDGSMLGKVKEVEDDDDESLSESLQSLQGSFHQMPESKAIEMLTRENALLRQQQQQQYNSRLRPRTSAGSSFLGNGYSTVPEESDFAIDELDEANDSGESFARRAARRRMSEYGSGIMRAPIGLESRNTDSASLKKAPWSSSLGFPVNDVSQSRRHSFANMPTRQGSISSIPDAASAFDPSTAGPQTPQDFGSGLPDGQNLAGSNAASYFGGPNAAPAGFGNPFATPFSMQGQQFTNRAPSPHRSLYGMAQPRHNQLLQIVLFKCARADVFYIQEGTGLSVKPGDLVIVEADRGTDLGTVARDNVDWQTAKELKEHYAEEQYKWLMMYSQGAAAADEGAGAGLLASTGLQGSAVGGMGPPSQHHMQEPNAGELRPKLIKRLAQSHEIHALRDKEGQEAKAKRVCMQKVKEHGLNMEILDAEFQMDWKKLTFYYFADSYINFNSLVTDLFKIYKTRIWMSAINPASFASPTLGIQAPSGIGPGAVGVNRSSSGGERRYNHQQQQSQHQEQPAAAVGVGGQGGRGYRSNFGQGYAGERSSGPAAGFSPSNYGFSQGGAFGMSRGTPTYGGGLMLGGEGFSHAGYQQSGGDAQTMQQRFAPPGSNPSPTPRSQGLSPISPQNDWTGAFQGLSLNSQ